MAESDVEPTPAGLRRWYQLHLSTCVALMFVAGGITWMNMSTRREVLPGTAGPAQVGFLEEYHDDSIGHVLWARRATRVVRLEKGLSAGWPWTAYAETRLLPGITFDAEEFENSSVHYQLKVTLNHTD